MRPGPVGFPARPGRGLLAERRWCSGQLQPPLDQYRVPKFTVRLSPSETSPPRRALGHRVPSASPHRRPPPTIVGAICSSVSSRGRISSLEGSIGAPGQARRGGGARRPIFGLIDFWAGKTNAGSLENRPKLAPRPVRRSTTVCARSSLGGRNCGLLVLVQRLPVGTSFVRVPKPPVQNRTALSNAQN